MWRSDKDGSCVHADIALDSDGFAEVIEVFDAQYLAEESSNNAYCNGPSPGNRFRVIYATTTSRVNNYNSQVGMFKDKARRADHYTWKSAQQTGGTRHIRYVCDAGNAIVVDNATLPNSADTSFSATLAALRNAGYNNANRKYLVYVEWKELQPNGTRSDAVCGRGELILDDSSGQGNQNNAGDQFAVVYYKAANCANQIGRTAMHEIGHTLGASQSSSPNHDGQNAGHPRDERDVMAYGSNTFIACTDSIGEQRYDCNKNDYFHTNPTTGSYLSNKWNTARSKFLVGSGF